MILSQKCTYWPPGAPDGFGGFTWGAPQILSCRWQDKQQLIRSKDGTEKVSDAVVYLEREIKHNGRLLLGEHTDAIPPTEAREPQALGSAVGLDGCVDHWKVWL